MVKAVEVRVLFWAPFILATPARGRACALERAARKTTFAPTHETAVPIDASRLAALDPCDAAGIRIKPHPSIGIIRSPYPIVTIWAMNSGERELAPIENWRGEDALVARPYLEVEVRALPPGGAAFLLTLAGDRPLGEAAEAALADDPDFDLAGNLAGLIGSGLVRGVVLPEPKKYRQP